MEWSPGLGSWEQELIINEYKSSYQDGIKILKLSYVYNLVNLLTTTELGLKMDEFYDI